MKIGSIQLDTPVAMIAAVAANGVIGTDNQLPWYLPEDLTFFKRMTQAKPLVMGRKTYASIGRALPGRLNIVVTRNNDFAPDGVRVCHDLVSALRLADQQAQLDGVEEIMVMGGGDIYAQAMKYASRLYLTEIALEAKGDAHFPALEADVWRELQRVPGSPETGQPAYDFVEYRRLAHSGTV